MDTYSNIVGSFELRMIDADIAHIRLAVEAVLDEPNSALPILYWRRRLENLLRSRHLLHHQFSAVTDLLARIEKIGEIGRGLPDSFETAAVPDRGARSSLPR